jgi:hypothetical protein
MKKEKDVNPSDIQAYWDIPKTDIVDESTDTKSSKYQHNMLQRTKDFIAMQEEKSQDAEGIMKMCTDLHLVIETVTSSVLSPKDLKQVELNFKVDKLCPTDWADILKNHFHKEYNLNSQLYSILSKALFTEGSHPKLVIPATLIRALIKANTYGLEDFDKVSAIDGIIEDLDNFKIPPVGYIRNKTTSFKYEDFSSTVFKYEALTGEEKTVVKDISVEFVDNITHALLPFVQEGLENIRNKSLLRSAYKLEDLVDVNNSGKIIYPQTTVKEVLEQVLLAPTNADEELALNPIVIDVPAHCIYPIHKPGKPEEHTGYLIGLDERGNFLSNTLTQNRFKELNTIAEQNAKNQAASSPFINGAGLAISYNGSSSNSANNRPENERENAKNALNEYTKMFEVKLMTMIAKSGKSKTIEVANANEFYQMMFFRQLDRQRTKILYVPAELISYIAFNYDKNGVGEGLIEKTKLFSVIRATLTFAAFLASVQLSINRTELSVGLDENDDDQLETIEAFLHEYMNTQQIQLPTLFNKMNPSDIINDVRRGGTHLKVNGGTRFPNMEIESTEKKSNITPPDDNIMDRMKEAHYAGLMTTVDAVNGFSQADFATTVVMNNLYHARRYQKIQDMYSHMLSHFVKMYILLGGPLYRTLKESFEAEKDRGITFREAIESIDLQLPRAETAVIKAQLEAYNAYSEFIEKAVEEAFLSNDLLRDLMGSEKLPNDIEPVKKQIIAVAKRQYLASEGMLPELVDLFINEDVNTLELVKSHSTKVIGLIADIAKDVLKLETKEAAKLRELEEKLNPEGSQEEQDGQGDQTNDDGTGTGEGSEEGDDGFGGDITDDAGTQDDAGFNDDFSNDDLENSDTTATGVEEDAPEEEQVQEVTDDQPSEEEETSTDDVPEDKEEEQVPAENKPTEEEDKEKSEPISKPAPRVVKEETAVEEPPVEEEEEKEEPEETEEEKAPKEEEEESTEEEEDPEEDELSDEEKEKADKKKKVKKEDVEDEEE